MNTSFSLDKRCFPHHPGLNNHGLCATMSFWAMIPAVSNGTIGSYLKHLVRKIEVEVGKTEIDRHKLPKKITWLFIDIKCVAYHNLHQIFHCTFHIPLIPSNSPAKWKLDCSIRVGLQQVLFFIISNSLFLLLLSDSSALAVFPEHCSQAGKVFREGTPLTPAIKMEFDVAMSNHAQLMLEEKN